MSRFYTTIEMMNALISNPKLKFYAKLYKHKEKSFVFIDKNGNLVLDEEGCVLEMDEEVLHATWFKYIGEKTTLEEALEAFENNATITVVDEHGNIFTYDGSLTNILKDENGYAITPGEILRGEWHILKKPEQSH